MEKEELQVLIEKLTAQNSEILKRVSSLEETVSALVRDKNREDPPVPMCPKEGCGKMLHRVKFYRDEKITESDYYCIEHGHQFSGSMRKNNEDEIKGNDEAKIAGEKEPS